MNLTARHVAGLAATFAIPLFALLPGCSRHLTQALVPNQKPQIELIDARVDVASRTDVRIKWAARDPDGEVARTCWTLTPMHAATALATAVPSATKASECVLPNRASVGPKRAGVQRPEPEILTLWAVDDAGAASDPIRLGLVGNNVAPIVQITCPVPSPAVVQQVTRDVNIVWEGVDPDGQTTQHPVKYKYKLLPHGNPEFDIDFALTLSGPDSLRNFYAARNWAGWDSVSGDTTTVHYTNLTLGQTYLFVITAFDEAGDYDPVFSTNKNMLTMTVGYASNFGPKISLWNSEFDYTYPTGGFYNDAAHAVRVEEPADTPLRFNWSATPMAYGTVLGYRWALDMADPNDNTTRTDPNDLAHWSAWSMDLSTTLGPFSTPGVKRMPHKLYVEASAAPGGCVTVPPSDGWISLGIVQFTVVRPTWQNELLIVDDTRLEVSKFAAGSTSRNAYTGLWPAAAELDTFLYAVGGVPWMDALGATRPNTAPGLFHGYPFDTLGTRGLTSGGGAGMGSVPLSSLTDYRHVIWIVDHYGGTNIASLTNPIAPMGALSYACTPGHLNALAEYAAMGGKVWVMGGAAGHAMTKAYDAIGINDNNSIYGTVARIYAGPGYAIHPGGEELTPGRFMFDRTAWRSMFAFQSLVTRFVRSPRATGPPNWTQQPGYGFANPVTRPDYTLLPDQMHVRTNPATDPLNGDALPPTRLSSYASQWWATSPTVDVEYLLQPNIILEDVDPDPVHVELEAALDTLMSAQSVNLLNTGSPYEPASMTWYHGSESPELVFTGFPIWSWRRSDGQKLVDFVLQQIWHINRSSPGRPQTIADHRLAPAAASAPRTSALPVRRSAQR